MNYKPYLLILIFLLLLTRIPLQSSRLYSWDSVQYALALKEYNVSKYQPHPSGYPVYVFAAKILFLFFKDENKSYLYLNLLLSLMAIIFLFKIGTIFFKLEIAFLISLLFISSPLFWSNAEIAVSYCAESAVSLVVAYFCLKQVKEKKLNFILAVFLGLGAGFRPNLILFLTPLFLFSFFISKNFSRENFKNIFLFLGILFFCILIWYVPMVYLSGGYKIYQETLASQFEFINLFSIFHKGLGAILINGKNILTAVFFAGFCFASFIPLIFFINLRGANKSNYQKISGNFQNISKENFLFFIFWISPPLLFYLFIFVDLSAYCLSYLPALFLLLGYFLVTEIKSKKIITWVVIFLIFTANVFTYLKINYPLQEKNIRKWQEKENYIKKNFNPKNTLLLGGFLAGVRQTNYFIKILSGFILQKVLGLIVFLCQKVLKMLFCWIII